MDSKSIITSLAVASLGVYATSRSRKRLFGTQRSRTCSLVVYNKVGDKLARNKLFEIPTQYEEEYPTLSVNSNHIRIALAGKGTIIDSSLDGTVQHTFVANNNNYSKRLSYPYIYQNDDAGNFLVADRFNNRIVVVGAEGDTSELEFEEEIRRPRAAVVFMNRLYAVSWEDSTLSVYEPVDK